MLWNALFVSGLLSALMLFGCAKTEAGMSSDDDDGGNRTALFHLVEGSWEGLVRDSFNNANPISLTLQQMGDDLTGELSVTAINDRRVIKVSRSLTGHAGLAGLDVSGGKLSFRTDSVQVCYADSPMSTARGIHWLTWEAPVSDTVLTGTIQGHELRIADGCSGTVSDFVLANAQFTWTVEKQN